jgi:hypothetical protein
VLCGSKRKVRLVQVKRAESVGRHQFFRKNLMSQAVLELRCGKCARKGLQKKSKAGKVVERG